MQGKRKRRTSSLKPIEKHVEEEEEEEKWSRGAIKL